MTQTEAVQAPEGDEAVGEAPMDNLLGLKVMVVFMGVLLVVAIITFFTLLFFKLNKGESEVELMAPEMIVHVLDREEVTDMTMSGRDLVLKIEGPEGRRIVVVNPYTAEQKAVVHLKEKAPELLQSQ